MPVEHAPLLSIGGAGRVAGDTGFRVFDTFYGRIGVGICW
jgi:predicted amidohydrolase